MFSVLAFIAALAQPLPTPQALVETLVQAPRADLRLQVACTEEQRERGLMSVKNLRPHTGMIFVFENDGPVAFWMKDTLIPLDMVFAAPDGTVRSIYARVPVVSPSLPDSQIPLEKGQAQFVVELPPGEAVKDGIRVGTRLKLPQRLTECLNSLK